MMIKGYVEYRNDTTSSRRVTITSTNSLRRLLVQTRERTRSWITALYIILYETSTAQNNNRGSPTADTETNPERSLFLIQTVSNPYIGHYHTFSIRVDTATGAKTHRRSLSTSREGLEYILEQPVRP